MLSFCVRAGYNRTLGKQLRFVLIGATAASAYVLLGTALTQALGWPVWLASLLAYASCVPVAYLGQKHVAFRSQVAHRRAFPRYIAVQVSNLALAVAFSEIFSRHLPPSTAFLAASSLVAVTSFVLFDRWTFAR